MPPPSKIAESRDLRLSRKTGFMRKIGKLSVRAISTLRPSRTLYNAVATLHVSEACPSVSASSNNYVCLLGARNTGVFLSRMTAFLLATPNIAVSLTIAKERQHIASMRLSV